MLALLLLRPNEVVAADRLADELWGEEPPPTAAKVVQVYVSQLRKALARDGRDPPIVTRAPGYLVRVEPGGLDVQRFERLLAAARRSRSTGDNEEAARLLRDALALWRGEPLADFTYEPFAQSAIARLGELRLVALEERIEADLELGRHAELVAELEALVAEHPLREGLRGQLMLALYRSGRQAEALDAFREARRTLVDELGIEPGPALQELEKAILRQDPALAPPSSTADAAGRRDVVSAPAAAERAVVVVPRSQRGLPVLVGLAGPLAGTEPRHELLLAKVLEPPPAGGGAELAAVTDELRAARGELEGGGVSARVAAFTSPDPAADLVRLASSQQADLLLLEAEPDELADLERSNLVAVLEGAPCDVALAALPGEHEAALTSGGAVLVPFGASEHDWAALELGCWLARAHGVPIRLLGTSGEDVRPGGRDASRLLADASLIVQRLVGLVPEPVLVEPGAAGILEASRSGGVLVVALSERWRREGIGPTRLAVLAEAALPVLVVRRGVRPGALAPPDQLSRFAWSLAGAARRT